MSEVPQVSSTDSPAHLQKRLCTCINCRPWASSSLVMLVRVFTFPLSFFPTWGLTSAEKVSMISSESSNFTAPNSMISLRNPFFLRL